MLAAVAGEMSDIKATAAMKPESICWIRTFFKVISPWLAPEHIGITSKRRNKAHVKDEHTRNTSNQCQIEQQCDELIHTGAL